MHLRQWLWKITVMLSICLLLAGCAQETPERSTSKKSGEKIHVTVEVRCDTAIEKGLAKQKKWKGVLPEDGCMLKKTKMEMEKGSSVFDQLQKVQKDKGLQMEYSGGQKSAYVQGIGNLYEQDGGRFSGWMYSVNGKYAQVSCGTYKLKDGDEVKWNYSCDLGSDLDGTDKEQAEKWKEKNE